jgi:hypothetical protein
MAKNAGSNMVKKLLYCTALYLVVLAFHGYLFGENDQIEQLSYVKYLFHPSLYPKDFYVQYIAEFIPNERYVVALLLSFLTEKYLAIGVFVLHYLCSISLFWALYEIASRYIRQEGWRWIALLVLFIPMYKFNLGGNDLYYNELLSGNLSKSVVVWAFLFILQKKYTPFTIFAIIGTFLHPVVGAQVFVLSAGAYTMFAIFDEKKWDFKAHQPFFFSILAYLLIAGTWLFFMLKTYNHEQVNSSDIMEFFRFRISHHFIPSAFGTKNYVVMSIVLLLGASFFQKKERLIFYIFVISISFAILYSIMVEGFHSTIPFTTQWFKTTIWLKAFAIIAIFGGLSEWALLRFVTFFNFINVGKTLLISLAIFSFYQLKNPTGRFALRSYSFPFSNYQQRLDIDIALKVKDLVPNDALFVQPASLTSFKFFSEKSSYVDIKTTVQSKRGFMELYRRIQVVYRIDLARRDFSKSLFEQADENFYALQDSDFIALQKIGITHVLTKKTQVLSFPIVAQNEAYVVYALR